jgi:FMN phosphatase YigB (HAD superfamily)
MIRAVLLDLDETLIANPDGAFAAAFVQLADDALAPRLGVDMLRPALRQMMQRLTAERTQIINNLQVIHETLAESTQRPVDHVRAALQTFYTQDYPTLARWVSPVSSAQTLIDCLTQQQIAVVIATNPVYPPAAIQQRIAWGGLDVSRAALITDASVMHFAKPDPAYYAELIARLGVEPDEALVIGDHPTNDIAAAQEVGLHTMQIDPAAPDRLETALQLVTQASWRSQWDAPPLPPTAILHALRGNLGALAGLIELAPPHTWHQHPLRDEWSLAQIVTHLLQSEVDTQRARIQTIMTHSDANSLPLLSDITGERTLQAPLGISLPALFDQFAAERFTTIRFLQSLTDQDWERQAHHSAFGYTTLREMAAFTAQHDRMHIQQFCQTLGRCNEE